MTSAVENVQRERLLLMMSHLADGDLLTPRKLSWGYTLATNFDFLDRKVLSSRGSPSLRALGFRHTFVRPLNLLSFQLGLLLCIV